MANELQSQAEVIEGHWLRGNRSRPHASLWVGTENLQDLLNRYQSLDVWSEYERPGFYQRYIGSVNVQTDIKEANFLGIGDEYVMAGSDEGMFLIWEAESGRLVRKEQADADVVNCCQANPSFLSIATSGIDSDIKIWEPRSELPPYKGAGRERYFYEAMAEEMGTSQESSMSGRRGISLMSSIRYMDEEIPAVSFVISRLRRSKLLIPTTMNTRSTGFLG